MMSFASSNETLLEQIAFNNFAEGCTVLDRTPSARVIHNKLNKLSYSETMAKQIENAVGNAVLFEMLDKGIVKHSSEYSLQVCQTFSKSKNI
jgi:hypothetical protein